MKLYKLLKDTPCIKAGTIFEENINSLGNKFLENKELNYYILVDDINNFDEWFERTPEYKRLRVELGGRYNYVDDYGKISVDLDNRRPEDDYRYNTGNYSVIKDELESYKEYSLALQTIKDDTKGFKPDWEDKNQTKYYGYYVHRFNSLHLDDEYEFQRQETIYFETEKDLKESFEKHRKEWLIVLGVEE